MNGLFRNKSLMALNQTVLQDDKKSLKDFLITCKTVCLFVCCCLIDSHQKLGTFLLNQQYLEMNEIDNIINKICSPNSIF